MDNEKKQYDTYFTEQRNEASYNIDKMSALEIARVINDEDKKVALAVETQLENIALAIDGIAERLKNGGRLIYIGAGTSGRLGVIDATECPPTYGVSPELIQGVLAGGRDAMFRSSEGMEDKADAAVADLQAIDFSEKDVCFGISASGSAEYVLGAIRYAKSMGALTVSLSCHDASLSAKEAEIAITPVVGPEVITGSTRMKSATAQKMVLTTVSTGVMVKMGRVHHNLMVCMNPSNIKLWNRAIRIICAETGVEESAAEEALRANDNNIRQAIEALEAK